MRPVEDSTVIGTASRGNSKTQTSPSPPGPGRKRSASSDGTRRSAEVRLTLAGTLPPCICVKVCLRPAALAGNPRPATKTEHPRPVVLVGG
jgi:hypothetical protein